MTHPAVGYEDHLWSCLVLLPGFRTAEQTYDVGSDDRRVAICFESLFLFLPIDDIAESEDRMLGRELKRWEDLDVFTRGHCVLAKRFGDHSGIRDRT